VAYILRPYRRFSIMSPRKVRLRDGIGTLPHLSSCSSRIHGNLPRNLSDVCSVKVKLTFEKRAIHDKECGIEAIQTRAIRFSF
jgi:hypothetical protein